MGNGESLLFEMAYEHVPHVSDEATVRHGSADLRLGDCLEVMARMPENSVDTVITDPPYHLTQASRGGSPRMNDIGTPFGRTRLGSRGFMGHMWDGGGMAFSTAVWQQALRDSWFHRQE